MAACITQSNEKAIAAGRDTMRPVKKGLLDAEHVAVSSDSAVASFMDQTILKRIKDFVKDNKNWSVMLVLLLRLRQCCCHLGLLVQASLSQIACLFWQLKILHCIPSWIPNVNPTVDNTGSDTCYAFWSAT